MAMYRPAGWLAAFLGAALGLAGCTRPPPEAFTRTTRSQGPTAALDIGQNVAREACSLQREGVDARIYCGDYLQAAGHVIAEPQATDPAGFVTESAWRTNFDRRFQCGAPVATTILDNPAVTLACTRRQGGWQHVVVATRIDGTLYLSLIHI